METMSELSVIDMDPNNNCREKSYSLRPRQASRRGCRGGSGDEDDADLDADHPQPLVRGSRRRRPGHRRKSRVQPLSKYRRKTANARERTRMREINQAFESLRRAVPVHDEKMTKIMTLRLAIDYISALSDALSEPLVLDSSSDAESLASESTASLSGTDPLPGLALLEQLEPLDQPYALELSLPLDPYDDLFALEHSFSPDFS